MVFMAGTIRFYGHDNSAGTVGTADNTAFLSFNSFQQHYYSCLDYAAKQYPAGPIRMV